MARRDPALETLLEQARRQPLRAPTEKMQQQPQNPMLTKTSPPIQSTPHLFQPPPGGGLAPGVSKMIAQQAASWSAAATAEAHSNLDNTLRIWRYRVFSQLSTAPEAPRDSGEKRRLLALFANLKEQQVRAQVQQALSAGVREPAPPPFLHSEPTWRQVYAALKQSVPSTSPIPVTATTPAAATATAATTATVAAAASPISSVSNSSMSASSDSENDNENNVTRAFPVGFQLNPNPVQQSTNYVVQQQQLQLQQNRQLLQQQQQLLQQQQQHQLQQRGVQVIPTWSLPLGGSKVRRLDLEATLNHVAGKRRKKIKTALSQEEARKRDERARRFHGNEPCEATMSINTWQDSAIPCGDRVVGLSQALEKPYLRLCGPPDPAAVRPPEVLEQSFAHCVERWQRERRYPWLDEQLRSTRQDLTVQGVKTELTLKVYEFHARLALQNSDLGQFNQCQSQLHELHEELQQPLKRREEFLCYRILYLALMGMQRAFLKTRMELTPEALELPAVKFALAVRAALATDNFVRAQRLLRQGPFLCSTLAGFFLDKLRAKFVLLVCRSHYHATLEFMARELGLDTPAAKEFLQKLGVQWVDGNAERVVACKASVAIVEASPLLQQRKLSALG